MSTPGSRAMTIGLVIMLLSVNTGMHSGGFGLLLCFVGVLIGASLVVAGVCMADGPVPIFPVVCGGARALAAFVHRNATVVGLLMASCAVRMLVSSEAHAHPVLCFATFALLLLGVFLINIGVRCE